MKYKVGIFGSSIDESNTAVEKAKILGKTIADYKDRLIILTGACTGIPYLVAFEAAKSGIEIWGYSPETDLENQKKFTPNDDVTIYKKLIYVPKEFLFVSNPLVCKKYRNVISTATCDAGIIVAGRWGTMNEFTNLFDTGKVIGVLTGTGGIADELSVLSRKISKESKAKIIFSDSAKDLIEEIVQELKLRQI